MSDLLDSFINETPSNGPSAPATPAAPGGSLLDLFMDEAVSPGSSIGAPVPDIPDRTAADYGRQTARAGLKTAVGFGSLLPEVALTGADWSAEALLGALNPALYYKYKAHDPYSIGDFSSLAQGDLKTHVLDPYLPEKPQDLPGLETGLEFGLSAIGPAALSKAGKAAGYLDDMPKIMQMIEQHALKEALAGAVGGTVAGVVENQSGPGWRPLVFGTLADLATGNWARLPSKAQKGKELIKGAIKEAPDAAKRLKEGAVSAATELDEKSMAFAKHQAVKKYADSFGGKDEALGLIAEAEAKLADDAFKPHTRLGEATEHPGGLLLEDKIYRESIEGAQEELARTKKVRALEDESIRTMAGEQGTQVSKAKGGEIAQETVKASKGDMLAESRKRYDLVDPEDSSRIAAKQEILDDFAKELQKKKGPGGTQLKGDEKQLVDNFLEGIDPVTESKEVRTWGYYNRLRNSANDAAEAAYKNNRNAEGSLMRQIVDSIDQIGDDAAKAGGGFSKQQAQRYQDALDFNRKYQTRFSNAEVTQILKDDPSQVGGMALRDTPEASGRIRAAVGDTDKMPEIKSGIIESLYDETHKIGRSGVDEEKFRKVVQGKRDHLSHWFDDEELENLQAIVRRLDRQQASKEVLEAVKGAGADPSKTLVLDQLKHIFQSRIGWKYPIERKVVQWLSANEAQNALNIDEVSSRIILEMASDPKVAKKLLMEYEPKAGSATKQAVEELYRAMKDFTKNKISWTTDKAGDAIGYVNRRAGARIQKATPTVAGFAAAQADPVQREYKGEGKIVDEAIDKARSTMDLSDAKLGVSKAQAQTPKTTGAKTAKKALGPEKLYDAFAKAETGPEKQRGSNDDDRRFIRTKAGDGASSAFGPVQITGSLAKGYLQPKFKKMWDKDERVFLAKMAKQGTRFLKSKNDDKKFGLGSRGNLIKTKEDKVMYKRVAEKILTEHLRRSKGKSDKSKLDDLIRLWRFGPGVSIKEAKRRDPGYFKKVHQYFS